jgi:hypothetical protein
VHDVGVQRLLVLVDVLDERAQAVGEGEQLLEPVRSSLSAICMPREPIR